MAESVNASGLDTSPERIAAEWDQIAKEQGFALDKSGQVAEPKAVVELSEPAPVDANAKGRILGLLNVLTFRLFKWFAPGFAMTEPECTRLNEVWSKVAAKYIPAAWVRWIPATKDGGESVCIEADAVLVTVEILEPRFEPGPADAPGAPGAPQPGKGGSQFDYEKQFQE